MPVAPLLTAWQTAHSRAKTSAPFWRAGAHSVASTAWAKVNDSKPTRGNRREQNISKQPFNPGNCLGFGRVVAIVGARCTPGFSLRASYFGRAAKPRNLASRTKALATTQKAEKVPRLSIEKERKPAFKNKN